MTELQSTKEKLESYRQIFIRRGSDFYFGRIDDMSASHKAIAEDNKIETFLQILKISNKTAVDCGYFMVGNILKEVIAYWESNSLMIPFDAAARAITEELLKEIYPDYTIVGREKL